MPLNWTCWYAHVMVFCGVLVIFEQPKIYVVLSASFGTEILDYEALGVGFEREDVDTDRRVLFFEEGDLFGLNGIIYSGHVECGFVTGIICEALFVDFSFMQGRQHGPQKTYRIVNVLYIHDATFCSEE